MCALDFFQKPVSQVKLRKTFFGNRNLRKRSGKYMIRNGNLINIVIYIKPNKNSNHLKNYEKVNFCLNGKQ